MIDTARRVAGLYGLEEWATPIFEETRVFAPTLGDTSDVVTKEMYTFDDRGGDSVTLRPENTAGVCRALLSNGLTQSLPQKVFYAGPMFRYERPQKGRYRQFHQIGAELIGVPEPLGRCGDHRAGMADPAGVGRGGQGCHLGTQHAGRCGEPGPPIGRRWWLISVPTGAHCRRTVWFGSTHNPLRILDSKDAGDKALVAEAPTMAASLTPEAATFLC